MFKAITAYTTKGASHEIVADLVRKSNYKLGIYRPSKGIFYASCVHETENLKVIIKGLVDAFPGVEIIGGTVVGGFTEESHYVKDGYFLCLLITDATTIITGCIQNLANQIENDAFGEVFRTHLQQNFIDLPPDVCLLYSAYNNVDGDRLIEIVQQEVSKECLVCGAMATDYWSEENIAHFSRKTPPAEQTLVFYAKDGVVRIEDDGLVFLLLKGNISATYGVSYGWSDIGMLYPGKAEGSTLIELDGRKPLTFLRELKHPLASEDQDNVEYALWFHVPGKEPFLRDIFFDSDTGNYHTNGTRLPENFEISFSFPHKENVLKEFHNCLAKLGDDHGLVIAITCCTHQVVLEQDICREYDDTVQALRGIPVICGYVFGEFGPSMTDRESMLHSCSSVLICLQGENDAIRDKNDAFVPFLNEIVSEQRREIQSLKKQLHFFEGSKNNKLRMLTEDCLGLLLCRSHKSLSSHAEQISKLLKAYYKNCNTKPPYAISRNRVIDQLVTLKKRAQKIMKIADD